MAVLLKVRAMDYCPLANIHATGKLILMFYHCFAMLWLRLHRSVAQSLQYSGYRLDVQGIIARFLAGERDFSLLHSIHPCSGGRVTPIQWVPYQGVKYPCRQADRLLPSSAKVENERSYTSILYIPSWRAQGHAWLNDIHSLTSSIIVALNQRII